MASSLWLCRLKLQESWCSADFSPWVTPLSMQFIAYFNYWINLSWKQIHWLVFFFTDFMKACAAAVIGTISRCPFEKCILLVVCRMLGTSPCTVCPVPAPWWSHLRSASEPPWALKPYMMTCHVRSLLLTRMLRDNLLALTASCNQRSTPLRPAVSLAGSAVTATEPVEPNISLHFGEDIVSLTAFATCSRCLSRASHTS